MSSHIPTLEAIDDTTGVIIPDPATIESIAARRVKAGRLVAGTAAPVNVPLYKGTDQHTHKPKAKRWDDRLNAEAKRRGPSSIKGAAKHLSKPGIISLGGGLPSSEYFPFQELSYKVPRVGHFSEAETREDGVTITAGKHDLPEGKSIFDISTALNYGQGTGSAQLLRWCVEHTELIHNPPYADWSCAMTIGSTSGLDMIIRMFIHPNMCILTEDYTFSTAAEAATSLGVRMVGVAVDDEGMLPDSLDHILSTWDPSQQNGSPKPFLIYTVPSGQNPTGATQSLSRRKALYAVAEKHDLLIMEDEPYYFLQMEPYTTTSAAASSASTSSPTTPITHASFLSALVPSYLSLDTTGRVIRIDSFSKVIAPGSRCGWITAPEQLCERYFRHSDQSTQGPSGFSQLALFKLLDEHWGHAGYLDWLIFIRLEYTARRNVMLRACESYLPSEVCRWKPPMAGMFHWIEVDWRRHPLASQIESGKMTLEDLEDRIWLKCIDEGTLLIKGSWFQADKNATLDTMFFRGTYAAAKADQITEAVRRVGRALRIEFGMEEGVDVEVNGVNGHA